MACSSFEGHVGSRMVWIYLRQAVSRMCFDKGFLIVKVVGHRFVKSVKFMVARLVERSYLLERWMLVIVETFKTAFW